MGFHVATANTSEIANKVRAAKILSQVNLTFKLIWPWQMNPPQPLPVRQYPQASSSTLLSETRAAGEEGEGRGVRIHTYHRVVVVRPARGESVSPEWGEISLHVWEGLGPQSGGRGTLRYRVLI